MKSVLVLVSVVLSGAPVFAGTILNMVRTSPSGGGFTVTIEGSNLRIDSEAEEEPNLIIFRADRNQLLLVNHEPVVERIRHDLLQFHRRLFWTFVIRCGRLGR